MTKLTKLSLAAFSGVSVAVLMLAVPANASTGGFQASVDELKRYCHKIDEQFWKENRRYGCGDKIVCKSNHCKVEEERRRRPNPPVAQRDEGNTGGDKGREGGNHGGNTNGRGGSSAGGPN